MSRPPKIVIDTNVLVSALKSRRGWSFDVLERIGTGQFGHVVTVPLVIEYEDVLDYFCASGLRQRVHFLWRPKLSDVRNHTVLEATEDSLELHARQGSRARFDAALAQVPDVAPVDPLDIK